MKFRSLICLVSLSMGAVIFGADYDLGATYGYPQAYGAHGYSSIPNTYSPTNYSNYSGQSLSNPMNSYYGYGQAYPTYASACGYSNQQNCGQWQPKRRNRRHRHSNGQGCGQNQMSQYGGYGYSSGFSGHGGFALGISFGSGNQYF